jgi:hypothetical protein
MPAKREDNPKLFRGWLPGEVKDALQGHLRERKISDSKWCEQAARESIEKFNGEQRGEKPEVGDESLAGLLKAKGIKPKSAAAVDRDLS